MAHKELEDYVTEVGIQDKVILVVGHSLGGGIAKYINLMMKNTQAITVDPANVEKLETMLMSGKRQREEHELAIKENRKERDLTGLYDMMDIIPKNIKINITPLNVVKVVNGKKMSSPFYRGVVFYNKAFAYENSTNLYYLKKEKLEKLEKEPKVAELLKISSKLDKYSPDYYSDLARINELFKDENVKKYAELITSISRIYDSHKLGIPDDIINRLYHSRKREVNK
ncbi:hypothetical protein [Oceanivirga salmonicida]|uniref:hypothetical protein n=1 Tax=Oceanivirga salmonicida TaxID=1769291 RepID=UPI00082EDE00|nr:hypothetical protein [Oceanivirga salmonicida]